MSENFEVRAKLTADDLASGQFDKLLQKLKQVEKQLQQSFAKNKITTDIIPPKVMKDLQGTGKEISGLTDKFKTMAREQRDLGNMSADGWKKITREVKAAGQAYKAASGAQKAAAKEAFVEKVKYAQAYRYIFNNENRKLQQAQEAHENTLTSIGALGRRRRLAEERAHNREVMRERRQFHQGLSRLASAASGARTAGMYVGAAAGVAGYAATSSVKQALSVDRAETNARMNMDQSKVNARDLRDKWVLPSAVKMGLDPAELFESAVDAAKAGVPEKMAAATAELAAMTAKRFGIGTQEMIEGLGRSISVEIGAGRLKGEDIGALRRKFNIASSLASETSTRPDEVMSFLRSGMGAGAGLGMSDVSTFAFGNAAVMAGAQGRQASRFLSHLGEQMGELDMKAKHIRQKSGMRTPEDKLFMGLPAQLGYGSYGAIQQSFKQKPDTAIFDLIKSFKKIQDPLKRSAALHSFFGSEFGPIMKNLIDADGMMDQSLDIAKRASGEEAGSDSIAKAWTEYQKGLENILDRVGAVWKVLKAELGDTFKPFLTQVSDWVTDWYKAVGTSGIKARLDAVIRGLITGFLGRPGELTDLLNEWFGKAGDGKSIDVKKFSDFGKGFAEGIKSITKVFTSIAGFYGGSDAEAMGKFTGQIVALVAALAALAPVMSVLGSLVTIVGGLVAVLGGPATIGVAAALAAEAYTPGSAKRKKGQSYNDFLEQRKQHKKELYHLQSGEGFDPANVHKTSFTSSVDQLNDQLKSFGGKVELASFRSTGGGLGDFRSGGGIQNAFYGGGGGSGGSGGGSIGGVPSIMNSIPGSALPSFGGGGIIKRGGGGGGIIPSDAEMAAKDRAWFGKGSGGIVNPSNVPSFNGGGGSAADGVGAGLSGNAFLQARRARFAQELKDDPSLGMHLAAMQATEGASKGGTIESLMNRADMQGKTLRQMLGYSADGKINPKSFYGPIRRGALGPEIARLSRNPAEFAKYNAFTQRALAGGHAIGGYTDQGLATDPNGSARTGIKGFKISPKDGNEFTDWVGPGSSFGKGRAGAMNYRKFIENGIAGSGDAPIGGVPSPADAVRNVPAAPMSPNGDASLGGGSRGNVAIHINGGNHDPEALATMVQRRVDESMNWRSHESESEYT